MNHVNFIEELVHSSLKVNTFYIRLAFLRYKILHTVKAYFVYLAMNQKGKIHAKQLKHPWRTPLELCNVLSLYLPLLPYVIRIFI